MVPFRSNEKYYSKVIPSYTSNDEFNANKHIWENNELPAVDPYDMSHSMLHDELWNWFLGSTAMTYDVPFNYETDAEEYFDEEDIITHASIAKYVNNVRAKNYGPTPKYHFEKDQNQLNGGMSNDERQYSLKEDLSGPALQYVPNAWVYRPIWPEYTRYEVNGTIAPEFDFLLHEGYRYLKTLYPNHPDYTSILTTNEINDEFNQIASFIDFQINCPFYDWLATQLDYKLDDNKKQLYSLPDGIDDADLYQLYRKEALKLKFRNLTKHVFRRKLFGSKVGYWLMASEAFQHSSIYPVGEYLPLKPGKLEEISGFLKGNFVDFNYSGYPFSGIISGIVEGYISGILDENDVDQEVSGEFFGDFSGIITGSVSGLINGKQLDTFEATNDLNNINGNNDYKWYRKLFNHPDLFKERGINVQDLLYLRPYRILDFANVSYDLPHRYEPPLKIYGTAYPNPLSPYDIYEYPVERDIYIPLTMQDDFYEGQKIFIGSRHDPQEKKTPAYLNAMYYEDSYRPEIALKYSSGILLLAESKVYIRILEDTISHVQVTAPVYPIYEDFKIYRSIKETLKRVSEGNFDLSGYRATNGFLNKFNELYGLISGQVNYEEFIKDGKVAIDVHQNGNIFLPAQQFLTLYRDHLKIDVNRDDVDDPQINYFGTEIARNGFIRIGDLLYKKAVLTTVGKNNSDPTEKIFISEICGLEGGKLNIEILKHIKLTKSQKEIIENTNFAESRYGVVLQFSKNNMESKDEKLIIFGKPSFKFNGPDYNNLYHIEEITFIISSIPRIKSINQLKLLYKDFSGIAIQKVEDLKVIFKDIGDLEARFKVNGVLDQDAFDNNKFNKYYLNEAFKISENYVNFKNFINTIFKKFDVENKTRKLLNSSLQKFNYMFNYSDWTDPVDKYNTIIEDLRIYNEKLDRLLIVLPNKTDFDNENNSLIAKLKNYQNEFFNDLVEFRFPIKYSVEGIETQINIIKPKVEEIFNIIQNIQPPTNHVKWNVLNDDYNTLYGFFNTFVDFFNYSSSNGGLQPKIKALFPEFKRRADDEIFAIKIQPIIHLIYDTIEKIKVDYRAFFDWLDKGKPEPALKPILSTENYLNLQKYVDEYIDFYNSYDNYPVAGYYEKVKADTKSSFMREIYNVIANSIPPDNFNDQADVFFELVENFRKPFIQEPVEYHVYLDNFFSEIEKYHEIFMKDLVDMPVLIENYPVRFPIEATMREIEQCLINFTAAFDDEKAYYEETVSYSDNILNLFRYENDIRKHNYDYEELDDDVDELKRRLTIKYSYFRTNTDILSINANEDFDKFKTLMINQFNEYTTFYNTYLRYLISTDVDREYYSNLDTKNFAAEQKKALASLIAIDEKLDKYMPNRARLLKPLPEDMYLGLFHESFVDDSSYSLLKSQDAYLGIFGYKFDNYNTWIDYSFIKEFSNEGIVFEFSPGLVNTAQIIHQDGDVHPVDEIYISDEPYIREYNLGPLYNNEKYISLNEDIIAVNDSITEKKFSYCVEEWLELFLQEKYKYNIEGEVPKRYEVEIRSIITKDSTQIEFIDETSKNRIYALTTGDQIIGPNIEDDTMIESIDTFNFVITVNKPLNVSGDFVLTYLTRYNLHPEEFKSNNFFDYRVELSHSGKRERSNEPVLVKEGSILEQIIPDNSDTSQYYVNGYIDILRYQQDLLKNLKVQPTYKTFFNLIVKNIHNDNKSFLEYYTLPSVINYYGLAYYEINAFRIYEKNNEKYLMTTDVLDYFQSYLVELSRASDKVNIGVNIIAANDTSMMVSKNNKPFTDPNIELRFVTTEQWSDFSIPTYIEVGEGCLDGLFNKVKEDDPQYQNAQDKSYYDYDVYDSHQINNGAVPLETEGEITYDGLENEGITLENDTGGMWSTLENESKLEEEQSYYEHVDIPVMKYYLGEYEVQKKIMFDNYTDTDKMFTTVQFSIIKQIFKDLLVKNVKLKQVSNKFLNTDIFVNPIDNYYKFDYQGINDRTLFDESELKNMIFKGEWTPAENNKIISYPPKEVDPSNFYYYSITKNAILSNVTDPQTDTFVSQDFNFGTVLFFNNITDKWEIKNFTFAGMIGDSSAFGNILKDTQSEDLEPTIINPQCNPTKENTTLLKSLLYKLLNTAQLVGYRYEDVESFTIDDLTKMFEWVCEGEKTGSLGIVKDENIKDVEFKSEWFSEKSKDSIYWFYCPVTSRDSSWDLAFRNINENPKMFALLYSEGKFYIYLLNHNRMFYLIDHSKKLVINENEWLTFIGYLGITDENKTNNNYLFPFEKIKQYQNIIDIPFQNLLKGSLNSKFLLTPHFTCVGNPYENEKPTDIENIYDITTDNIYFDKLNNRLYSFNDKEKFAIKQENNKYFKNVLYLYCKYNTELITQGTEVNKIGKLTEIPSVTFDLNYVSLKDRLLQIEQINIRSNYNVNLETTQFSNYLPLTGIINGIFLDGTDQYLSIGFRKNSEPKVTGNRLRYANELNKLYPLKYNPATDTNDRYPYQFIDFYTNPPTAWSDGTELLSPMIQDSKVYKDLTIDSDLTVFKFYKNTLMLEGKIDVTDPGYIDFTDNPKLGDALTKVSTGDKIVSIVGLNVLQSKSYKLFELYANGVGAPFAIEFLDYNNGYLVGVGKEGTNLKYFIHPCLDLNDLGEKQVSGDSYFYRIDIDGEYSALPAGYSSITSLSYDSDNQQWLIGLTRNPDAFASDIYALQPDNNLSQTYTSAGYDVNTYQPIIIRDEDYGDVRYNISGEVYARDIAFEFIPDGINGTLPFVSDIVNDYIAPTTGNYMELNGVTRFHNWNIPSGDNKDFGAPRITLESNSEIKYKTLTFLLKKESSGDESSVSIGVPPPDANDPTNINGTVKEIWQYNYNNGMWEKTTNMSAFNKFVTNFDASGKTIPVIVYIVKEDFLYINSKSEFVLRDLPAPPTLNTIAIVLRKEKNFVDIKSWTTGPGTFAIYDYKVITQKKIESNIGNIEFKNSDYIEGPYNPLINGNNVNNYDILHKDYQFNADKFVAYSGDYQAVIIGNTLFIKSPTRIANPSGDSTETMYSNNTTIRYHWKKAELPSITDITYALFNEMTLEQAYNLVDNQYGVISQEVEKLANDTTVAPDEKRAYEVLSAFLKLNPPIKTITDETLEVNIHLERLELINTEAGLIPNFNSNLAHWWQSTIDSKFELGNIVDVYLKRQNYLRYLADYYYAILGVRRFEYMFEPGNIKDILLTEKSLTIHTKYDDILTLDSAYFTTRRDIENYNNWKISNIDEDYIFGDTQDKLDRVIGYENKFVTVKQMPIIYPDKAFKILNKYLENNISIYCGYIKANERVVGPGGAWERSKDDEQLKEFMLELFPNNSSVSNDVQLYDIRYPVIYYSTDGNNFSKCDIPATQPFLEIMSSITSTSQPIEAYSIVREGNIIKVFLRKQDGELQGFTSFTVGIFGSTNTLTYNSDLESIAAPTTLINNISTEVKNGFLNALNTLYLGSGLTYTGKTFSRRFMINQQYRPDVTNALVSLKEDSAIRYAPAPPEADVSEILSVLVAIDTRYLIEDQSQYIDYDQKYIEVSTNTYKVPEFIEVKDRGTANRMYSPRECLPVRPVTDVDFSHFYPREMLPKTGMPAVSEDIEHNVYEYYEPFNDGNSEIWKYREATNSEGGFIYLCDEKGSYLAQIDITSLQQIYDLRTIIENNFPLTQLAKAPTVRSDYSAIQLNSELTELLNSIKGKTIKYVSFAANDPTLRIKVQMDEILTYFITNDLFYKWPTDNNNDVTSLENLYFENTANNQGSNISDFVMARSYIEQYEGIIEKENNKTKLDDRFGFIEINGQKYIVDKSINTIMIKEHETIVNNFNVPYLFQGGIQVFLNKGFTKDEDERLLSPNLQYPITGIYLPTGGYGGYLDNKSWIERPDEIDFRAWNQTKLLINQFDEYIYQCDYRGNKIQLKYGLFFVKNGDKVKVSYDNIAFVGENKFYISETEESTPTEYNLIKIKPSTPEIYSPKETIYLNDSYNETITGTFDRQNRLILVKIYKAGINIFKEDLFNTADNSRHYTIDFLDAEDKPVMLMDGNLVIDPIYYSLGLEYEDLKDYGYITIKWNTAFAGSNIPSIQTDVLKLRIYDDYSKQTVIKEYSVRRRLDSSTPGEWKEYRIATISESYFFEENIAKNSSINITFMKSANFEVKPEDGTISPSEIILNNSNIAVFNLVSYPQSARLFIGEEYFRVDIRKLDLNFYTRKNWVSASFNSIISSDIQSELDAKVYSGDNELTNFAFSYSIDKVGNQIRAVLNSILLHQHFDDNNFNDFSQHSKYIFLLNESLDYEFTDNYLVDGLYGIALIKVPNYESFYDLLDKLENIIEYKRRKIINTYTGVEFNNVIQIANNKSSVTLDKLVSVDEGVFLKIKILPVQSIYASLKYANNPDFVYEVTQQETMVYGLDRIWINEKSYPLPPININNVLYNSVNIPYYYDNTWKNKNNFSIYLCNEEGKYVKYLVADMNLIPKILGSVSGDIRNDVFGNVDPRINPREPIYKSSLDWFISQFYIEGQGKNPFNLLLNLEEKVVNGQFVQDFRIQKIQKEGNFLNYVDTDSEYISSIANNLKYDIDYSAKLINQDNKVDYIANNKMNFTLLQPTENYKKEYLFLYGIEYFNQYYSQSVNSLYPAVWNTFVNIDSNVSMSFIINSFENLFTKDRDVAIKWFTEMGIFNQYGKLIAYCHHPKVEYRSDTQHISYTTIIEEN